MTPTARVWVFHDLWHLPASAERTWDVLADPTSWPLWWPGLEASVIRRGDALGVGTRGALAFATPVGALRLGLETTAGRAPRGGTPGRAVLRAVGDLRGHAVAHVLPDGVASVVRITWRVRVARPGLARATALVPGLARASHAVVMRRGERGLRRHLTAT